MKRKSVTRTENLGLPSALLAGFTFPVYVIPLSL